MVKNDANKAYWPSILTLGVLLILMSISIGYAGTTQIVSISSDGTQGNEFSNMSSISDDGHYVAFRSLSSNLVPNDNNGTYDIFVHDRETGSTEIITISSSGVQGNDKCYYPEISGDGRYVTYYSYADNLVPNDTNGERDVFVFDRILKTTEMVSVSSSGVQGNGYSIDPRISSDGRYIVFGSSANNLIPIDSNGPDEDIFIHNRETGVTEIVSINSNGIQGNASSSHASISANGQYITFWSASNNLVQNDTNGFEVSDIFVHDRATGITEMVSVSSSGIQGNSYSYNPRISADGRHVVFLSEATNLVPNDTNWRTDVFAHDRVTGITEMLNVSSDGIQGNNECREPNISGDGRYVTFDSNSDNLASNDTNGTFDVFVHDRVNKATEIVSINSNGIQANGYSAEGDISTDGRFISFNSFGSNLSTNDVNGTHDVFVHEYDGGNSAPIADAGFDQTIHVGMLVTLNGGNSSDPDGNYPLLYNWFIDSKPQNSTAQLSANDVVSPSFTSDVMGDYYIGLVVTDSLGLPSTADFVRISTTNSRPEADAGEDQVVTEIGTIVQLDGLQSYDNDGDDISYLWTIKNLPTGSIAILNNPISPTPTFVADVNGSYEFELVVSDTWELSFPDTVVVSFNNVQPVADAGDNQIVIQGDTVYLDGSGSTDANGDPLTYNWNFVTVPSGSQAVIFNPESSNTSFIGDQTGIYVVSLVVNDGFIDSEPDNVEINVINTQNAITDILQEAIIAINNIAPGVFKNRNMQDTFTGNGKILGVIQKVIDGDYADALDKLENDILKKMDGCAKTGAPDKTDWIRDCEAQNQVYPLIIEAIGLLEDLMLNG